MNKNLLHVQDRRQCTFNLFGGNPLAVGQLERVLSAINKPQLRRRYHFSNVSRIEETVRVKGALRLVRSVEVTLSHFARLDPHGASWKGFVGGEKRRRVFQLYLAESPDSAGCLWT